jgi:deoxyadenosine/deoxycytidine kinase
MRDTRIVFVEGVLGAGKSTTVARIVQHLGDAGVSAQRVSEGDERLRVAAQLAHGYTPWLDLSVHQYIARCRKNWNAFVSAQRDTQSITVCDGLLFHGNLTDLVLMDADSATIASYYEEMLAVLAPLRPSLIYLRMRDITRAIRDICVERGKSWEDRQVNWKVDSPFGHARHLHGVDGLARLYEHFAKTCDALVAGADLPMLRLADDRSWSERERTIFDWLGA